MSLWLACILYDMYYVYFLITSPAMFASTGSHACKLSLIK